MCTLDYKEAKGLIEEADLLLFRSGKFPGVGWWIGKYTQSFYSHAALASWDDELECVEFREFKGSRTYPLYKYIEEGKQIDVFRPVSHVDCPCLDLDINEQPFIGHYTRNFTPLIAKSITNTARSLIGRKYSYWTIWQMFKTYIPFVRLRSRILKNGEPEAKRFVCSTLVTFAYRMNYIDPVPFLCDSYTSPGDLARSSLFCKLFSIKK